MILGLRDIFRYGNDLIVPDSAVSAYRYIEHLVEATVKRKFNLQDVLEIGPGADSSFMYIPPSEFNSCTILDYNPAVLDAFARTFKDESVKAIVANVEEPKALAGLAQKWDLVLANALLEHLVDDVGFVKRLPDILIDGGMVIATTVLNPKLYNLWDHAVGHYRRYLINDLYALFKEFHEVQILQTSLVQELVRPLFFGRVRHLRNGTLVENNLRFANGQANVSRPPYTPLHGLMRWFLPLYLVVDWSLRNIQRGIAIVIARK